MTRPSNEALSDKLREMADVLEVQHEDGYRIAAYRRAARTLLELDKPIQEIVRKEGLKGVLELPGIGRGIGTALVEIVTTGHWSQLDRLSGSLEPEKVFQTIPGLGPELAARSHNELDVDTLEQLEQAAHDGCPERVAGVGARRALAIKGALSDRLGHRDFKRLPVDPRSHSCWTWIANTERRSPPTQCVRLRPSNSILQVKPGYRSCTADEMIGDSRPCSQIHRRRMN